VLLGGEGVHLPADGFDRLRDLAGRALVGALEQEVLEEVRDTGQLGRLVARAHVDPEAQGHRPDVGHPLADESDAVAQRRGPDGVVVGGHSLYLLPAPGAAAPPGAAPRTPAAPAAAAPAALAAVCGAEIAEALLGLALERLLERGVLPSGLARCSGTAARPRRG